MPENVNIIIIGAAGDGRSVADLIESNISKLKKNWYLLGYLDDDPKKQRMIVNDYPVLGPLTDIYKYKDCKFIVSIGSVRNFLNKREIINKLKLSSENYMTLIHADVQISKYASIGIDCILHTGTYIGANSIIKNHIKFLPFTVINHDTIINDFCNFGSQCSIAGNVEIEESCYIGMNVSVREDVTIGEGSLIGMGSVITKDVPPFSKVVGNPGRIIGNVK